MKPSKKPSPSSDNTPLFDVPLSPFGRRFLRRVQNTAKKYALWKKDSTFVVAVSGGPDSLCLLDVLARLRETHRFTLHIAHVNYRLRDNDSDLDESLVRTRAEHYHIPCTVLRRKNPVRKPSEETLRDIRYAFFEKVRNKTGADLIVVAHNEDDQAETFLLRLIRGAGLTGLSAMRPKNSFIVRPLIETSRADILHYLKEEHLSYRKDRSNDDPRYLRNRIRHQLLPLLEKDFQPNIRRCLAETAALIGDEYALIEHQRVISPTLPLDYSRRTLLALPDAALRQMLRSHLKPFLGTFPKKNFVYELIKALKSDKGKERVVTFGRLKFICRGDRVRLLKF